MQAKYDRLETDYRPHPPRAYQQGIPRDNFQISTRRQETRWWAFELAKYFETSGQNADAAKMVFPPAAERFRRSDWKIKAQARAGSTSWRRTR